MPFPFVYVCDLLETLERPHIQDFPLLPKTLLENTHRNVRLWICNHRRYLGPLGINMPAVLSTLRPEVLIGREYDMDEETLQQVIARVLCLRKPEYKVLKEWQTWKAEGKQHHLCDLGACLERVMPELEGIAAPSKNNRVTVEEIDQSLKRIAASNSSSSTEVQSFLRLQPGEDRIDVLKTLYTRLQPREGKWLTRFILKDYGPICVPDVIDSGHHLRPPFKLYPIVDPISQHLHALPDSPGSFTTAPTRLDPSLNRRSPHFSLAGRNIPPRPNRAPLLAPRKRSQDVVVIDESDTDSEISSQDSVPYAFARGILHPRKRATKSTVSGSAAHPTATAQTERPRPGPSISTVCHSQNNDAEQPKHASPQVGHCERPWPTCSMLPAPSNAELTVCASSDPQVFTPKSKRWISSATTPGSRICPTTAQSPCKGTMTNSVASRPVLGQISANSPSQSRRLTSSPRPNVSQHFSTKPILTKAGHGKCRLTKTECPIERCIFLLPSSLSISAALISELLPWHGCLYTTRASSFSSPHFPLCCPKTRKPYRKIALVDTYNVQETRDLIRQIQALDLQHKVKRGRRDKGPGRKWAKEYVEVCDWRLLQYAGKIDCGQVVKYDFWKRCAVAMV